jgi:hypothetical protein
MSIFEQDADGNVVLTPEGPDNVPVSITDGMVDGLTKTNERWPAWSPDGASIAVWSGLGAATSPSQHPALWVVAADGTGNPVRITDPLVNPAPLRPDWGPAPAKDKNPCKR